MRWLPGPEECALCAKALADLTESPTVAQVIARNVLDADVEPAVMAVEADFNEDRDGGGGHGRLPCGKPRSCVK